MLQKTDPWFTVDTIQIWTKVIGDLRELESHLHPVNIKYVSIPPRRSQFREYAILLQQHLLDEFKEDYSKLEC